MQNIERGPFEQNLNKAEERKNDWQEGLQKTIDGLIERSPYQRSYEGETEVLYNPEEGERYQVGVIEKADNPDFEKMYGLFDRYVEQMGLVDSAEDMKSWLMEEEEIKFFYIEKDGEIVSANCVGLAPIANEKGERTTEGLLLGHYAATKESVRDKGLTKELFSNVCRFGLETAKKDGLELKSFVTEAADRRLNLLFDYQVEGDRGQEKMKPFYYDQDGNLCEVPYKTPDTGDAYHLMIRRFDGRETISTNELLDIVRTVALDYYEDEEDQRENVEEWQGVVNDISSVLEKAQVKEIHLLSYQDIKERKKDLESENKQVIERESAWEKKERESREK
jgi:hypothetical protein